MKPDGSAQRHLADAASEPTWLPDSRRIAFVGKNFDGIHTIRTDGRSNRLLVKRGRSPAWSANGKTFAYVIPDPSDDHVYVRRNGRQYNFVSDTEVVDDIVISPDGRFLAISGNGEVAVHRPDGQRVLEIQRPFGVSVGAFEGRSPAWSPRGDLLAFADDAGLEVVDVATQPPQRLRTLVYALQIRWLAWAPSGNEIVFPRDVLDFDPRGSIWTVSIAGRLRHFPSTSVGVAGSVAWSSIEKGLHFKPPLPDSMVVGEEVRNRAPIDSFDADGDRVAFPACGRTDLWSRPGTQITKTPAWRLYCSSGTNAFIYSFALAGNRVAFGTVFGGTSKQAQVEVSSLAYSSLTLVASSIAGDRADVGGLVGDRELLAFGSWGFCLELGQPCIGVPARDTRVLSTSLWRVRDASWTGQCPRVSGIRPYGVSTVSGPCQQLATEPGPFAPMDADSGRLVAAGDNATVILDEGGKRLLTVPVKALAAQLSGSDLVVIVQGVLRDYDAESGSLLHAWPLPDVSAGPSCGLCPPTYPRLRLEDAANGLALYTLDGKAHVLRLLDGADAVIGAANSARFGDTGVFYAYDGPYPWRGRIRFVPFEKLPVH